ARDVAGAETGGRGVAVFGQGLQVVQPGLADGTAEQVRRADGHHQRRVGAEAAAEAADALRIGIALLDGPAHAIDEVVLHARAPLAIAGALEVVAAPFAAAEVDLEHDI